MDEWEYKPAQDLGVAGRERLRSVKRESGLIGLISRNVWWLWVRGVLRMAERIEVFGSEHLPASPPFVMVANHASHLDVMVLATALPLRLRNCVFPLAAGDTFFETPAVAAFAAGMMNALPDVAEKLRPPCYRYVARTSCGRTLRLYPFSRRYAQQDR